MVEQALDRYHLLLTLDVRAFWVIVGLYAVCLLLHVTHVLAHPFYYPKEDDPETAAKRRLFYGQAAAAMLFVTVVVQALWFVLRSYERSGSWMFGKDAAFACPLQTRYELYQFFAWTATLAYLFVRRRWAHIYMPGLLVNAAALGAMLAAAASNWLTPDPAPVISIMKSQWYVWHMGAAFMAYGFLAVSFAIEFSHTGARILHALRIFPAENRVLVEHPVFHADAHKLVMLAFPILTFAIIAGAAWTLSVWGTMWSWSALGAASVLAWLIFGVYLHAMRLPRWRGVVATVFNLLGFLAVATVFTGNKVMAGLLGLRGLYS